MSGWQHWLNGYEFEQTHGDSDWQGNLACCSSWGGKESEIASTTNKCLFSINSCAVIYINIKGINCVTNYKESFKECRWIFFLNVQLGLESQKKSNFFFYFFLICSEFCHTLKWNVLEFTCLPHPEPPSHRPLHPLPPGLPRAPGPSACLMHPTWAGDLFHPW